MCMPQELDLQLLATPTLQLPNIGPGDLARMSATGRATIRTLMSMAQRRVWTEQGVARADGSFPIPTVPYLRHCLAAYKNAVDKPAAKRWLIKRAHALERTDLLPEAWGVVPREVTADAGP